MKNIKLCEKYKRMRDEEGGYVGRWFGGCEHRISVVKGNFPSESEIRITPKNKDSFKRRGKTKLILKKINKNSKKEINRFLDRKNKLNKSFK